MFSCTQFKNKEKWKIINSDVRVQVPLYYNIIYIILIAYLYDNLYIYT